MRSFARILLAAIALVPVRAGADDKAFAYVNGGYDAASNYSVHEQDLLAFRNRLFASRVPARGLSALFSEPSYVYNGDVAIFNAGGDRSPVIPILSDGSFKRNSSGWITTEPSNVTETRPATQRELNSYFDRLAQAPPKSLTIVWGDHGSAEGISLWDDHILNAREIQSYYRRLPPDTWVRGIHLHCYGNAAMVEDSPIPVTLDGFREHVRSRFAKHRCGLALGLEDEVGQYYGWSADWSRSPWTAIFDREPKLSLARLRNILDADDRLRPTMVLTSDQLLRDLSTFVCRRGAAAPAAPADCVQKSSPEDALPFLRDARAYSELCGQDELKGKIKEADEDIARWDRRLQDVRQIYRHWAIEWAKLKWGDFYRNYKASQQAIDKLRASLTVLGDAPGKEAEREKIRADIARLRDDYPARFERALSVLKSEGQGDFAQYFWNNCSLAWLRENTAKYPDFQAYISIEDNAARFSIRDLDSWALTFQQQAQAKRKALISQLYAIRKREAAQVFDDPRLKPFKELYDDLERCEATSLR